MAVYLIINDMKYREILFKTLNNAILMITFYMKELSIFSSGV